MINGSKDNYVKNILAHKVVKHLDGLVNAKVPARLHKQQQQIDTALPGVARNETTCKQLESRVELEELAVRIDTLRKSTQIQIQNSNSKSFILQWNIVRVKK